MTSLTQDSRARRQTSFGTNSTSFHQDLSQAWRVSDAGWQENNEGRSKVPWWENRSLDPNTKERLFEHVLRSAAPESEDLGWDPDDFPSNTTAPRSSSPTPSVCDLNDQSPLASRPLAAPSAVSSGCRSPVPSQYLLDDYKPSSPPQIRSTNGTRATSSWAPLASIENIGDQESSASYCLGPVEALDPPGRPNFSSRAPTFSPLSRRPSITGDSMEDVVYTFPGPQSTRGSRRNSIIDHAGYGMPEQEQDYGPVQQYLELRQSPVPPTPSIITVPDSVEKADCGSIQSRASVPESSHHQYPKREDETARRNFECSDSSGLSEAPGSDSGESALSDYPDRQTMRDLEAAYLGPEESKRRLAAKRRQRAPRSLPPLTRASKAELFTVGRASQWFGGRLPFAVRKLDSTLVADGQDTTGRARILRRRR